MTPSDLDSPCDECTSCEHFPTPVFDPETSIAEIERHFSALIDQARIAKEVIILIPTTIRGHEMFTLPPGPRADMVLAAVGRYRRPSASAIKAVYDGLHGVMPASPKGKERHDT